MPWCRECARTCTAARHAAVITTACMPCCRATKKVLGKRPAVALRGNRSRLIPGAAEHSRGSGSRPGLTQVTEEREKASNPAMNGVTGRGRVGDYPDNNQNRYDDANEPR